MGNNFGCCGKNEEDVNNINTLNLGSKYDSWDKVLKIVKI